MLRPGRDPGHAGHELGMARARSLRRVSDAEYRRSGTQRPMTRLGQDLTGGNASKWNQAIGGRKAHRKDQYSTAKIGEGRRMGDVHQWSAENVKALRTASRMTKTEFARKLGVTLRSVTNWEEGRPLSPFSQSLLDRYLSGVADEVLKRFSILAASSSADGAGQVKLERRRTLLAGVTAVAAASGLLGTSRPVGQFGMTDVARVRAITTLYRSVDYEHGGGALYREVARFAETVSDLLHGSVSDTVRPVLLTACAEVRQLAGWTAFDAGHHTDAQRHWLSAERAAVAADDARLAARIRYCQARQFQHLRHNRDAVETVRLAREHVGVMATPAITAMLDGAEASSLAALGQHDAAQARLVSATGAFEQADHTQEPDWMAFFDLGEVYAQYGRVYRDMARQDPRFGDQAVHWTTQAITAFGPQNVRSTVLNQVGLCSALFIAGAPDEAVTTGNTLLSRTRRLVSARVTDRVRNLRRDLTAHRARPAVRDFEHALTRVEPVIL
ncbi:helix-turn-helix domain-containing protein [Polymorphospora sp. NPDC050346]|uniref:helix-turn-helix domain-containing protein n=1 Tax=Polymorphospora sp. NPDC050346 TaxID=3155780 RepID=UPI0033F8CF6F